MYVCIFLKSHQIFREIGDFFLLCTPKVAKQVKSGFDNLDSHLGSAWLLASPKSVIKPTTQDIVVSTILLVQPIALWARESCLRCFNFRICHPMSQTTRMPTIVIGLKKILLYRQHGTLSVFFYNIYAMSSFSLSYTKHISSHSKHIVSFLPHRVAKNS